MSKSTEKPPSISPSQEKHPAPDTAFLPLPSPIVCESSSIPFISEGDAALPLTPSFHHNKIALVMPAHTFPDSSRDTHLGSLSLPEPLSSRVSREVLELSAPATERIEVSFMPDEDVVSGARAGSSKEELEAEEEEELRAVTTTASAT